MVPYYNGAVGGTFPIDWYSPYSTTAPYEWTYGYTTVTTYMYRTLPPPPKNWRWFDVFREWEQFIPAMPPRWVEKTMRRTQERFPIRQRQQQKRRGAVQKMRASLTRSV